MRRASVRQAPGGLTLEGAGIKDATIRTSAMSSRADGFLADGDWPPPRLAWYAVAVLTLAYVFSFIDRTILALLVDPIKADLGISDTQIGLLQGFTFAIFYVLMGLPIGWLADRGRRNLIIAAGIFTWSLMTAACGLARTVVQLFLARIGVGIGEAALSPPAYSMMADYFPPERLGRPVGVYSAGVYVGVGLAFMLGGGLVQFFSQVPPITLPGVGPVGAWQLAFIAVGMPGVLVAALMLTVPEPRRRGLVNGDAAGNPGALGWIWRQRRGLSAAYMLGFSILGMPVQAAFAWAPTWLIRHFGFSPGEAGLVLGGTALVFGMSGMLCGGWMIDRFKAAGHDDAPLRVGLVAATGAAPFALTATLMNSPALALALLALVIFFVSCGISAAPTGLQQVTPNACRAQVSAVYMLFLNLIGTGAAPAVVGLANDLLFRDPAAVGWSMALLGIAPLIAAGIFLAGRRGYREAARLTGFPA